jgi:hypothetical protein
MRTSETYERLNPPALLRKLTSDKRNALELYDLIIRFAGYVVIYPENALRIAAEAIAYELERDEDSKALAEPIKAFLLDHANSPRY